MGLKKPGRKVKSVQTALEIIEYIQKRDGATLTELCEAFELAQSTVHSYMSTLESMEYIIKEGDSYQIGLKFLSHGIAAKNTRPASKVAEPVLEDVASTTDAMVWHVVEEHGRAVFLNKAMTDAAVRTYGRVGKRAYLHTGAGGKAILAHLDDDYRQVILNNYGLPEMTDHTITDVDQLTSELSDIRENGYATSQHETVLGVSSIAAPIVHKGDIFGAVQLCVLTNRVQEDIMNSRLREPTIEAAGEISERYAEISG